MEKEKSGDFGDSKTLNEAHNVVRKLRQSTEKIQEILDESSKIISGENLKTINGQSLLGKGNIEIQGGGGGGSIDPELLEGFMPLHRQFSDDFNNDYAR